MECINCGYRWSNRVENPTRCPRCQGRLNSCNVIGRPPKFIPRQFMKQTTALLLFTMLLVPALPLLLITQAGIVMASPGTDAENLWVNNFDPQLAEWRAEGTSPYLDDNEGGMPNDNYVFCETIKLDEMGDFLFSDLLVLGTINSVTLNIFGLTDANDVVRAFLWDGDWDNYSDFNFDSQWQWRSVNVTSVLNTYAKVDDAKIKLQAIKVGGFGGTWIDAAYLEVNYTVPPPGKPTLIGPENGITTADTIPTFSWENGEYAENHRIEVDDNFDFSSIIDSATSFTNTWSGGEYGAGTYYWRVWAVNIENENVSENVWEFTVVAWWDVDWSNRRQIDISPINPENYQIRIFLDNLLGMKSDLSDLRFMEVSEFLPHWIENYNYSDDGDNTNDNATIWVRRLENYDNFIYVYYSNSSASSIENGDNTFPDFFDHFEGDNLDGSKWDSVGTPSVSNSIATLNGSGWQSFYENHQTWFPPQILRMRTKLDGTNATAGFAINLADPPFVNIDTGGDNNAYRAVSLSSEELSNLSVLENTWQTFEIRWVSDNQRFYIDNVLDVTHTLAVSENADINFTANSTTQQTDVDWVLVRKYMDDPEPVTTVGEQEPPPVKPTKPTLYYPGNDNIITDETPQFVWIKGLNADYHQLLVSSDSIFSPASIVENENISWENNYTIPNDNFLSDGKYWWNVTALSENGENASDTWSFTLKAISVFEASSGVDKIWSYRDENIVFEVEMSPDGELTAIGTYGVSKAKVRVFNRDENIPLWTDNIAGNTGALAFNDNGQYLAAGTESNKVRFYDNAENGNILWTDSVAGSIQKRTVNMSPDGKYVVAGTSGGLLRLYKGIDGDSSTEWTYDTNSKKIWETTISPLVDGKYRVLAVGEDGQVFFFDNIDNNTPDWTYKTGNYEDKDWTMSVDISDNGDRIVVGAWDNKIYLFDSIDNTPIWVYEITDNTYHTERHMWFTATISNDGQYIAAGIDQQEGKYYLFPNIDNTPGDDAENAPTPIWSYDEFGQEVRDVKISGDGSRIIGSGWGGRVYNWNIEDNIPIWIWGDATFRPGAIAISNDGSLVAVSEWRYVHLMQDGSFAYELRAEEQIRPYRILTTTPEFKFGLPSRKVENTISFRIAVGENVLDSENLMWNHTPSGTIENENEIYITYTGLTLSPYVDYQWRVRLRDNENNWSAWSVTRNFEIVELVNFDNYRTISLTENISDNYQIRVVIDNTTNMGENLQDLLFYDSTYPNIGLPYWIENADENMVWVRVHDNGSIILAYNNSSARDASYGDDTFPDLFDNFDGPDISVTKWLIYSESDTPTHRPSISDGIMSLYGNAFLEAGTSYGTNLALRTRARIEDSSDNQYIGFVKFHASVGGIATPPSSHFWGVSGDIYLRTALATAVTGQNETTSSATTDYDNAYTIYELKRIGTDNVELWANDDNLVLSSSTNISPARVTIYIQTTTGVDNLKVDWIFLRKCLAIEPTVTIGEEETWSWRLIENWSGIVEAPVGWELIEQWSGAVQAAAAWQLVNIWAGTIEAPSVWELIETWSGTIESIVSWNLIEEWLGTIEAFSGWQLIETLSGIIEAPAIWQLIEQWIGAVDVYIGWQLIEDWSGMIQNPPIPTDWILIETWTGTLLTTTLYGDIFITSPWSDGRVNPTDVTTATPGFSAVYVVVDNSNPNPAIFMHIQVGTSLDENDLWDNIATVTVENGQRSIDVDYDGIDLILNTSYWWRSRFGDSSSSWTEWTLPQTFGYEDEPFDFFAAAMFVFPIALMGIALIFDSPIFASFSGIVFIFSGLFFVDTLWLAMIFVGLGVYLLITAFFADWED